MHVLFATLHYSIILYSQAQFEKSITINIKSFLKKIEGGILSIQVLWNLQAQAIYTIC